MLPPKIFIDSNLLLLLVIGETNPDLILKHRRSKTFQKEDYYKLVRLIHLVGCVLVTAHILTETSNLLTQHKKDSQGKKLLETLQALIEKSDEIVVPSKTAIKNKNFKRLGLTDAALLEVISPSSPLITVDHDLYQIALTKGEGTAFNFRHYQFL